MANTRAIWQQAAHTTHQLSSPSCSTWAIQKKLTLKLMKNIRVFWKKSQENGPLAEKWQDRKSKRTRQKKTREEIGKGNQMTALRFQTGGGHQTSLASLRGCTNGDNKLTYRSHSFQKDKVGHSSEEEPEAATEFWIKWIFHSINSFRATYLLHQVDECHVQCSWQRWWTACWSSLTHSSPSTVPVERS